MRRGILIGGIVFSLAGAGVAATPKGKPAPKQPVIISAPNLDVLGLRLGAEFALPECPIDAPVNSYLSPRYKHPHEMKGAMPCFQQGYSPKPGFVLDKNYASVDVVIDQLPAGLRQDYLSVKVIDGKIENVSIATYGLNSQAGVLDLLTEKYGTPTVLNRSKVQNRMGAEFDQIDAEWKFSDLSVMFVGMGSKIDMGIVDISTPIADAVATAKREQEKAAAPKL